MADLDGDETRRKILFCDGSSTISRSVSSDHRSPPIHAKATSEMWQPSKATKLFEHILAFLKEQLDGGVSARGQREWQTGHRVLRGRQVRDPPA